MSAKTFSTKIHIPSAKQKILVSLSLEAKVFLVNRKLFLTQPSILIVPITSCFIDYTGNINQVFSVVSGNFLQQNFDVDTVKR